jgi:hypothetical protein
LTVPEKQPDRLSIALILILPVMLVKLIEPLHSDNALYQSMAYDLFHYGRLPYIGSWDHNTPGILLFHLVPIAIAGNSEFAFRLFDVVLQMLFAAWLFRVSAKLWDERAGFAAVLLFGLYQLHAGQPVSGQRDLYAIELLLIAGYRYHTATTVARSAVAGALLGIILLIKPTFAVHAGLILLFRWDLRSALSAITAALATLLLSLVPFALSSNGLSEYYYSVIRFNSDVYSKFGNDISAFWYELKREWYLIVLGVIGAIMSLRANKRLSMLYCLAIVGALMLALLQGKYMRYHFAPFFVLLLPLAGLAVAKLTENLSKRTAIVIGAYALVMLLFAYRTQPLRAFAQDGMTAAKASIVDEGEYRYADEQRVLDYLRPIADAGSVEVISLNARLRGLLGARSATHFTLVHSLGLLAGGTFEQPQYTPYQERWRKTFVSELASNLPDRIVIAHATHSWYLRDPGQVVTKIPGFDDLISSHYAPDTVIGVFEIFERRQAND